MFKELNIDNWNTNVFNDFGKKWALVTSGTLENHNSLTVGWGSFGVLWRKKIAIAFVRESRYTYKYLENNDYYTISFYNEKYRNELKTFGTVSGRDKNKDELTSFHPKEFDNSVSYEEADLVIVCKIIYKDQFNPDLFIDKDVQNFYKASAGVDDTYHHFYIGEIVKVFNKS